MRCFLNANSRPTKGFRRFSRKRLEAERLASLMRGGARPNGGLPALRRALVQA